jgi:hypothetical protein
MATRNLSSLEPQPFGQVRTVRGSTLTVIGPECPSVPGCMTGCSMMPQVGHSTITR